ncbi:hypothetical protein [Arcticibacter tournemirensis]|uniref:Tetratricopeptide repeat protein n=1 Tax=Arcticibacter tournemirensis TaxID=699437 RepID=A0A4Q0MAS2_9SPHI|nr:hypothetical protein [Arcticibacter tournemirensis]KAA8479719.1 hypothetical protein F1649_16435 [Arcticibacter tournemirensis]RXF70185.1 hypothetical protein EKH83_09930 [Arcticibacter tournemirensis]
MLILEYSPVAALNRTFALAKARGKEPAIAEAEKLNISNSHFYFSLLGNLYSGIDRYRALSHFKAALDLAHTDEEKTIVKKNICKLEGSDEERLNKTN